MNMASKKYTLKTTSSFDKQIMKLESQQRLILLKKMNIELRDCEDPRSKGKALKGELAGLWRYRYGDYRVIVKINDNECIILAVEVGHRKDIYKKK